MGNFPPDVRFMPDGQHLVVADDHNNRIQLLALDGSFVKQFGTDTSPRAVAVDAAGNIIATTKKHMKVFSSEGTLLHDRLGGLEIGKAAEGGVAIDPLTGRIAVGDMVSGRIYLL